MAYQSPFSINYQTPSLGGLTGLLGMNQTMPVSATQQVNPTPVNPTFNSQTPNLASTTVIPQKTMASTTQTKALPTTQPGVLNGNNQLVNQTNSLQGPAVPNYGGGFNLQDILGQISSLSDDQKRLLGLLPSQGQQDILNKLSSLYEQAKTVNAPNPVLTNLDQQIRQLQLTQANLNPTQLYKDNPNYANVGITQGQLEREAAAQGLPIAQSLSNLLIGRSALAGSITQQQQSLNAQIENLQRQQQLLPSGGLPQALGGKLLEQVVAPPLPQDVQEYNYALRQGLVPRGTTFAQAQFLLHPEKRFKESTRMNPLTGQPETIVVDLANQLGVGGGGGGIVGGTTPSLENTIFGSSIYTTDAGNRFLKLDDFKGTQQILAKNWAAQNGVKALDKEDFDHISEIDHVRGVLQTQLDSIKQYLPSGGVTRALEGFGAFNTLRSFLQIGQSGVDLASYKAFKNNAIAAIRGVGGSKGLRVTQAEINTAISTFPEVTDSLPVAQGKINNLNIILNDWENRAAKRGSVTAPITTSTGKTSSGLGYTILP